MIVRERVSPADKATAAREYCESTSDLFASKSLYILLERFGNLMIGENPEYAVFLNRYFNDEGYVDFWRIPHLMMDLAMGRCEFHKELLHDKAFRAGFICFIGDFYNYCIRNTGLLAIEKISLEDAKGDVFHMRKNQFLYNLIAETYCKIYNRLNSY